MSASDSLAPTSNPLGRLSPWSSRSATPTDHVISHRHNVNLKYPADCPGLDVRWFYAVDVPKRKPAALQPGPLPATAERPVVAPKKFEQFSLHDSRSIEAAFRKDAEEEDSRRESVGAKFAISTDAASGVLRTGNPLARGGDGPDTSSSTLARDSEASRSGLDSPKQREGPKVPVQEDYLFDVDIVRRELGPAYWLGPIYEVRRGTWFYQEGSNLRPCEENLANQLEEGYLKVTPFRSAQSDRSSGTTIDKTAKVTESHQGVGSETDPIDIEEDTSGPPEEVADNRVSHLQPYRLFGAYMSTFVTYQDSSTAWLKTDSMMSRVSSTMYERFGGGGYYAGTKVIRGFRDTKPSKKEKRESVGSDVSTKDEASRVKKTSKISDSPDLKPTPHGLGGPAEALKALNDTASVNQSDTAVRQLEQQEIQEDYRNPKGNDQGREIEHLLLVTHGIGQKLGLRLEAINFIHDVNVLRKTLKAVYSSAEDLQDLNDEIGKMPKNCRLQVLPVCWRHLLDFPRRSFRQTRKEHDLGDLNTEDEEEQYPSLQDITVEGIPQVRNLISDLGLDILLYQSSYREHISRIVLDESNRIYNLFLQRTPNFKGKVHLIGHSLGSAIYFDLLCKQRSPTPPSRRFQPFRFFQDTPKPDPDAGSWSFSFPVSQFYCLGSPVGLFQMLKGRTIASRSHTDASSLPASSPSPSPTLSQTISSPACTHLFNIFHPSDPIAYRLEPLISPAMSSLKPQPLPYKKKTLFGAPAAGLSELGNRVSQGMTGLWSSLSTGIASGILNRSLGIQAQLQSQAQQQQQQQGGELPAAHQQQAERPSSSSSAIVPDHPAAAAITTPSAVTDPEIETLFTGFQKRDASVSSSVRDSGERARREEEKVTALNAKGRVDYAIQEGVFDISLLASIQSHLAYWGDEDVNHFLLGRCLEEKKREGGGGEEMQGVEESEGGR